MDTLDIQVTYRNMNTNLTPQQRAQARAEEKKRRMIERDILQVIGY